MPNFEKSPTEDEFLRTLKNDGWEFPPLKMRLRSTLPPQGEVDAIVECEWAGQRVVFALEFKASSTPRTIRDAAERTKAYAQRENLQPLIVVPFLNPERLAELEREGVSGIDLCGNGAVVVPGRLAVYRTGARNKFPNSAAIKNIYQRNSSTVARVFLARPRFGSVREVQAELQRRSLSAKNSVSLATVSKALKTMQEDLIIRRAEGAISLLQPDKLLDKLARNYSPQKENSPVRAKVPVADGELFATLLRAAADLDVPLAATGTASVTRYAVMQRGPVLSVYCAEPRSLLERVAGDTGDRFPNVEIIEAREPVFYFDTRLEDGFRWASPVQVYLELTSGDKRDRETAEQVRELILNNVRTLLA